MRENRAIYAGSHFLLAIRITMANCIIVASYMLMVLQGLEFGRQAFFMLMLHEILHAIGFSSTDFEL